MCGLSSTSLRQLRDVNDTTFDEKGFDAQIISGSLHKSINNNTFIFENNMLITSLMV